MHNDKAAATNPSGRMARAGGVILSLTLLTALVCWFAPPPHAGGDTGVVMELPDRIGPLLGISETASPAELYILPADTTYARKTYGPLGAPRSDRILCSIILSGAEKRSIHRPERCLPAQNWRIDSSETIHVQLESGRTLGVTALLLEKPATLSDGTPFQLRSYFLYWFVGKDVTTPSNTERLLLTNWDLLAHRVNQRWAYVIVQANITHDWNPDGLTQEQTLAMLEQFIHDSVPTYMKAEMPDGGETAAK